MALLENFASVYDEYSDKIYRFYYYRTFHRETAEDLTSQTFMKAVENAQKFDETKGNISAWLYTIANHILVDHYRRQKNHDDLAEHEDLATNEDLKNDTEQKMMLAKIRQELKHLPEEQRMIVLLRVWDGLSYKEIAEIMGKSEDTCKMTFSRTVKKLQTTLNINAILIFFLISSLHTR